MANISPVTCHVLDTEYGRPATGVKVIFTQLTDTMDAQLAAGETNEDGRITNLLPAGYPLKPGTYKMTFITKPYFEAMQRETFFSSVEIFFNLKDPTQHYHIPLLLSAFSYSTYRGS